MFESAKAGPAQNRRDVNDPIIRKNMQRFLRIEGNTSNFKQEKKIINSRIWFNFLVFISP